jgi:putative ABC transport system ATP-binding protein
MTAAAISDKTYSSTSCVVEAWDVSKIYRRGQEEVRALDQVTFQIAQGEFLAVVGASGAGKSTLLQLIGGMDIPSSGRLVVAGNEMTNLSDGMLTKLRRNHIGFVFQQFSLLPSLSVAENVGLPAMFAHKERRERVGILLERVGLSHRRDHRPNQLSGGEMQRAAIARALINEPDILLADEPTGNLDSATSGKILELFQELNADGLTVVVVTHSETLAAAAQRSIVLADGKITPI